MTDRPVAVLAHGLGGSTDLPIPYSYALIGAAWALTFTFAVVALAWRRPRFDPAKPGRPLPQWVTTAVDAPVTRWALAAAGLLFAVWVAIAGLFGPREHNPLPGVFYVLLWVGLVAVSLALGPVWRAVSPLRTVYRLLRAARLPAGRGYPRRLGYWPAAFGLFAFVWLELASPDPGSLDAIKLWLWVYVVVTLTGAIVCGERWFGRADPFEVYSIVASRFSPFRRNPQSGRIEIGNPVRPPAVAADPPRNGHGARGATRAPPRSTASRRSPEWRNFVDRHAHSVVTVSMMRTAGLLVFVTVVVGDVLARGPRHRRRRSGRPPAAARADGALADSDRARLRVRPLPLLSGREGTAGRHRPGGPVRPRLESARPRRGRGELCSLASSFGVGHHQGLLRGRRPRRRCRSPHTTARYACCRPDTS